MWVFYGKSWCGTFSLPLLSLAPNISPVLRIQSFIYNRSHIVLAIDNVLENIAYKTPWNTRFLNIFMFFTLTTLPLLFYFMYISRIFIVYLLFVPTNAYIHIKILNYVTSAPTGFGASASSSGSFHISFAKVIRY